MDREEQTNDNSSRKESNTETNETLERPPPMLTTPSNGSPMAMENAQPSRSKQFSASNTVTPSINQGPDTTPSPSIKDAIAVSAEPAVTIQVEASATNGANSTGVTTATSSMLLKGSGARVDSDALPGVNQAKPELIGGARENADALPGVNQGKPDLTDDVMPGKKQPFPSAVLGGSASLLPTPTLADTSSSTTIPGSSTFSPSSAVPSMTSSETLAILPLSSPALISSTLSIMEPLTTSDPGFMPQVVTFVTVTRTEEGREYYSTQSLVNPQTINTPQTFSSSIPAPPAMETVLAVPAASESFGQQRGLTPVSRALFILFGVLGKMRLALYQHWF